MLYYKHDMVYIKTHVYDASQLQKNILMNNINKKPIEIIIILKNSSEEVSNKKQMKLERKNSI